MNAQHDWLSHQSISKKAINWQIIILKLASNDAKKKSWSSMCHYDAYLRKNLFEK